MRPSAQTFRCEAREVYSSKFEGGEFPAQTASLVTFSEKSLGKSGTHLEVYHCLFFLRWSTMRSLRRDASRTNSSSERVLPCCVAMTWPTALKAQSPDPPLSTTFQPRLRVRISLGVNGALVGERYGFFSALGSLHLCPVQQVAVSFEHAP